MLGSAKKAADDAATPHRNLSSLQQTLSNALNDATTPQNIEDAEVQSPRMKVDTLKLLGESVKLNAQTGPAYAFFCAALFCTSQQQLQHTLKQWISTRSMQSMKLSKTCK